MPSIRDMNMKQLNGVDWSSMSFEPETLKNHPSIISKILKTYPNQVANFCVSHLDLEVVRCIGVDNVVKLIKRAGVSCLKRKDPLSTDIMISEFQYPKQFLNEFKSVLDMSKLYAQKCADVDMLIQNIKELSIIETLTFNAKNNNKNPEFISKCKNYILDAMNNDYNSYAISVAYIKECCPELDLFSEWKINKIRHKKITKKLANDIETFYNMVIPNEFIDKTVEEIAYKINTNQFQPQYLLLAKVYDYLRDEDDE